SRIFPLADADGGTHRRGGVVGPVNTAAGSIDGVHVTGIDAEKYSSAGDGGLSVNGFCPWKSERPLQLQAAHLLRCDLRPFVSLEAGVGETGAPAIPGGLARPIAHWFRTGAGVRHRFGVAFL